MLMTNVVLYLKSWPFWIQPFRWLDILQWHFSTCYILKYDKKKPGLKQVSNTNFLMTNMVLLGNIKTHKFLSCKLYRLFKDCILQETVLILVASILTWGSISGQRQSWPSPTPGAGGRHRESHKKIDGDVEGRHLLGPCQTGSHQTQLPTAGRPGRSVHGHGVVWVLPRFQHQCWPVLGLEEK